MAVILNDGKLTLSGDVGDFGFGEYFTHAQVVVALAQIDDDAELTVYLNSGGGYVDDGAAIHAILSRRSGPTNIVIDGMAASSASLIAMAGDTITMSLGSMMMIHDPAQITIGNSADHAKTIEELEAFATSFARIYAAKSGKSVDECRAIMKAETWLTAEEAVAAGFADDSSTEKARPVAAFDYRAYAHAPKRLTALAAKKNWRLNDANQAATAASTRPTEERSMTDKTNGGDDAAELKRLREENATMKAEKDDRERRDAIMALPEAAKRQKQAAALCEAGLAADKAKGVLAASPEDASDDGQAASGTTADNYEASRAAGAGMQGGRPAARKPGEGFSLAAEMRKRFGKENA